MNIGNRYSQHSFAQIPDVHVGRSKFDRSFGIKDTFDFDWLNPIFVDEVLPGDTFNLSMNVFARLATQKVPIMDNLYIDYFFFFVPNRLVWDNWEKFNGAQANPGDSTDYVLPTLTAPASTPSGFPVGSIYDKMGLPTDIPSLKVNNVLPLRAYTLIWNEWFREQNTQNSWVVPTGNGPDLYSAYTLLFRNKRHDYFTSALPWPQKGPDVFLPITGMLPVLGIGPTASNASGTVTFKQTDLTSPTNQAGWISNTQAIFVKGQTAPNNAYPAIYANAGSAITATINDLREAFQMQSLFELDARGGTRYIEILRAHFGVTAPDFRLQRPEYLGGGTSRINVHVVAQTSAQSATGATTPQGNLSAFATSQSTSRDNIGFTKSFVEHGYIIGLACARADITYQQGMNRMWNRKTRYDFFWPKLQQLGEQEILNKEIYAQADANDDLIFGYQERYAEYRYKPSEIHGQFRSTYAQSLDIWHMAEKFTSLPTLSAAFLTQVTPISRSIAVTATGATILFDAFFKLQCARPMMTYGVPASLGRF